MLEKYIEFRAPIFRYLRKKVNFRPLCHPDIEFRPPPPPFRRPSIDWQYLFLKAHVALPSRCCCRIRRLRRVTCFSSFLAILDEMSWQITGVLSFVQRITTVLFMLTYHVKCPPILSVCSLSLFHTPAGSAHIGLYTASVVSLKEALIGWSASDYDASIQLWRIKINTGYTLPSPTWRASPTWRKQKAFPLPGTAALWVFWKSREFPAFFRGRGQSYARRHGTWNSLVFAGRIWFLPCLEFLNLPGAHTVTMEGVEVETSFL